MAGAFCFIGLSVLPVTGPVLPCTTKRLISEKNKGLSSWISRFQALPRTSNGEAQKFFANRRIVYHANVYDKVSLSARAVLEATQEDLKPGHSTMKCLIFDCDGVIVESEEGHRLAYNVAFDAENCGVEWGTEFYGDLQNKIGGGKEKMTWYFNTFGWPGPCVAWSDEDKNALIEKLVVVKTDAYADIVAKGQLPLRPGIRRVITEAKALGIPMAVCSAANRRAVELVLSQVLGEEYVKEFSLVLAGDDVKLKKPHPDIYLTASARLGIPPDRCVVIEDSRIGLIAAKAAGMKCVITYTHYTADQDFGEADAVFPELGDGDKVLVSITDALWD